MRVLKNAKVNLENKRKIFLQTGFIVALILVIAAFEYRTYDTDEKSELPFRTVNVDEEWAEVTIQKPKPPPELPKQRPQVIEVVPDEKVETNTEINLDASGEGPVDTYELPSIPDEPDIPEDSIFISVQSQPEFPGGYGAFLMYLRNTIKYPNSARELGIQGTVYIKFVLEKDGRPSDIRVVRDVTSGCSEEAVRAIEGMPAWTPAKQRGKAVRYEFTLPVKFVLK